MCKKLSSMALALVLLLSLSCSALAASPYRLEVTNANAMLTFSGNTALCSASVYGKKGTTRLEINVYLQRADSNGIYRDRTSWSQTVYTDEFTLDKSVPSCISGEYRLLVEATVYGSSGSGEYVKAASLAACY